MNWETHSALLSRRSAGVLLAAAVLMGFCGAAFAGQDVALAWKPSPDTNAVGYALYYGTASGTYTTRINTGASTNCTVPNLTPGVDYYFVAMAYDTNGFESPPSNEVSFTVPTNNPPTIVSGATTVEVSSSQNPCLPGQAVTFTAALSVVTPQQYLPTGTVQFIVDGTSLGDPVPLNGGLATFTTTTLSHGLHQVLAEYGGDTNFLGATNSLSAPQVINTPPVAASDTLQSVGTNGLQISASDLMQNDSDADGDPLTFLGTSATSAQGGSIIFTNDVVCYIPPAESSGTDSFSYTLSDGYAPPVTATVFIHTVVEPGSPPTLALVSVANGSVVIRGQGVPGQTYRIEYIDGLNLLAQPGWQTLGSATADSSGAFSFVDTGIASQRFYRTVYP